MRALSWALILGMVGFCATTSAFADCTAARWNRSLNIKNLTVRDLTQIDRKELYGNLYYELSHSKNDRIPGLGAKLFRYLMNTENNDAKYHLLQALEETAQLDGQDPQTIRLKDLCLMDAKASAYKGIAEDSSNN